MLSAQTITQAWVFEWGVVRGWGCYAIWYWIWQRKLHLYDVLHHQEIIELWNMDYFDAGKRNV